MGQELHKSAIQTLQNTSLHVPVDFRYPNLLLKILFHLLIQIFGCFKTKNHFKPKSILTSFYLGESTGTEVAQTLLN